jgi:hypothetical protein
MAWQSHKNGNGWISKKTASCPIITGAENALFFRYRKSNQVVINLDDIPIPHFLNPS